VEASAWGAASETPWACGVATARPIRSGPHLWAALPDGAEGAGLVKP
jgi:hypothetical protein